MLLSDFDFELPQSLIAQQPVEPRDSARLLQVGRDGLADRRVRDLPELLRAGDLLVVNDTRVLPARLTGKRGEAGVEVTLHKAEGPARWRAFARPAKRLKPGDRIVFASDAEGAFAAEVAEKHEGGELALVFERSGPALIEALERHGAMPLPPYIKRPSGAEAADRRAYQTVFAQRSGAVAAPTAGLHFTEPLLEALAARGIERTTLTLHVGAGTFLPVKHERVEEHRMHAEWASLSAETAAAVARTRARGGRVVAVGTTALRTLESAARPGAGAGLVEPFEGETSLFILPGYRFKAVDLLMTNFHLPRSTLFMLVAAFSGLETMRTAYAHAIAEGYRFFSYGDACLLERQA
ncbi:S-adenosylmethionine:tRNA ribosyltransferase-isomerase [Tistlia consotensis]|uniref:S-adenosylmethionine:tRNA ribosyltransferase-isomerase n=1 Tax=Tistlia consotensis USBA 355 TaxID=560819 RepID=A0A1Y6CFK6_9PROT|nr:tRNA preQ1(34) S-adenosylmethionine ribosyltransferase-isomerase QueA [Tistlia consotensis]SMF60651.1 S-adenosylmethionine:tRNA ribosyltransferase-isomerase [Tistlia consotensis USBA 355]SNR93062.1 S-adenosylmethionine:tRNA ribosyltransferase-isomerase [Tistlia consotensis]